MELRKPKGFINNLVYELHSGNFFVELKKLADNEIELKIWSGCIKGWNGTFRMRFVIRMNGNASAEAYWMVYDEKNDLRKMGDDPELVAKDLKRLVTNSGKAE